MRIVPGTSWSVKDAREYIMERVAVDARGCWIWQRSKSSDGYGSIRKHGKFFGAHRLSYIVFAGDPGDMHVCHTCDVRACCNPEHLWLGTPLDNARDCSAKGRTPRGERSAKARLTEPDILRIFQMKIDGATHADVCAALGVSHTTVCHVLSRRVWSHVPVPDGYAELVAARRVETLRECAKRASRAARLCRTKRSKALNADGSIPVQGDAG